MFAAAALGFAWSSALTKSFVELGPEDFQVRADQRLITLESTVDLGGDFVEIVPSWNAQSKGMAGFEVRIQAIYPERNTREYILGSWSTSQARRTSVRGQKDADGEVQTDILVLSQPARKVKVSLQLMPGTGDEMPDLKAFYLSLSSAEWKAGEDKPVKEAWGRELEVPRKAQGNYPNGGVLCSPTSVSMIMNYWSGVLGRPELAVDVPEVQAGVYDPVWGGTGNWPFNMAYPASFSGINSFVTRLRSINDLERFVLAGIPVALSVSYDLLRGRPTQGPNDGHLVVLVGFDADGDAIINDPAIRAGVRKVYPRADVIRGWGASRNTTYVVRPSGQSLPAGDGPWPAR